MNEQLQWQLFLDGEENALAYFFRKYHLDLFHYGIKLCNHPEIVKDSIQEMFLKLWRNRMNLSPVKTPKPYLLKVLRRHIQVNLDTQMKYSTLESSEYFQVEFSIEDFMIESEDEKENCRIVLEVLNQLSPRQREAIYLRYFNNLEFDTISQVMDLNIQSVRNAIHRGLQVMREMMVLENFLLLIGLLKIIEHF
ncbi:MAG TPA: sigma-70 family RNA polymerase sigma factor [Bacteroidales bacterium]|nr:sigma-70 family RNA polymerase sigma factor [Bacteroidales bacterium]